MGSMLKFIIAVALLLFSISTFAQDKEEKEVPQINVYSSALQLGGILGFGDKSVKFKEVVSDSRCPKKVTCVWAGEAKVRVEIFENGAFLEEKILTVNSGAITLNFSAEEIIYRITGMTLTPYPTVETKNLPKEYTLHMSISERM